MEIVARRKGFLAKYKYEPLMEVEAEVGTGSQIVLWRSWTFCLLVGCIFTITVGLWGANLTTPYGANTPTPISGQSGNRIAKNQAWLILSKLWSSLSQLMQSWLSSGALLA